MSSIPYMYFLIDQMLLLQYGDVVRYIHHSLLDLVEKKSSEEDFSLSPDRDFGLNYKMSKITACRSIHDHFECVTSNKCCVLKPPFYTCFRISYRKWVAEVKLCTDCMFTFLAFHAYIRIWKIWKEEKFSV